MEHYKKDFLTIFCRSFGIVSTACKKARIGRTTFYRWLKQDPLFKQAVEDIEEQCLDLAESQLFKLIGGYTLPCEHVHVLSPGKGQPAQVVVTHGIKHIGPDTTAIIFYLKTQGKKRGYVIKTQRDHQGEETITITLAGRPLS